MIFRKLFHANVWHKVYSICQGNGDNSLYFLDIWSKTLTTKVNAL